MMGDRILITASRTWASRPLMEAKLGPWFSFDNVLVSGHCRTGGDAMAEEIWAGWLGFSVSAAVFGGYIEIHPADWNAPCRETCRRNHRRPRRGSSHCPAAGDYRNLDMIALGARKCLAFACLCEKKGCRDEMAKANDLPPYTHGTLHCGLHASRAGIDTEWIEDDRA